MAATNFIPVDPGRTLGGLALSIRDHIVAIQNLSAELNDAILESIADDASGASLAPLLGATTTTDDAVAIKNLVGSVHTDINNVANSFLQYKSRVNRQT